MRNIFKTSYEQDIRLFEHSGHVFWYGLLLIVVFAAPLGLPQFYIGEISQVFIYAVAGIGLMLLTGFTGLASLGHAAFLGIGAYAHNYFFFKLGVPFPFALALAGFAAAAFGIAFALPALRMTGIYLAIATLAFAVIMEQVFSHWAAVTGGFRGLPVGKPNLFGWELATERQFYYLCLAVLILITLGARNILRSATGRAMMAIRDSEISARSMGVHIARTKVTAFGLSTFVTGIAGGLLAHKLQFISPEAFDIILSIQLLLMIVVGGLGSLHGCFYGAVVVAFLPQFLALMKDLLPPSIGQIPGLQGGVFGLILVLFVVLEPLGIYGRWRKVRLFFEVFPLYRRATFKRQRAYLRTERMR
ncbi:MAG: branched-chain amino acid ABC transporter permease [Rhodospirillaceae bacterium]|nr:branched-chain amino acid ABC transporter permease [Rhodospirillaceae bacterium]